MSIKMSLFALVACSLAVISTAAPSGFPLALSAPVVAPAPAAAVAVPAPVVTAYSSQYVARNYNGIAVAPAAVAPAVVPSAAYYGYPQVYAPAAAYTAGLPLVEDYLFK